MGKTQTTTEGTEFVPEVSDPVQENLTDHIVTEETLALNPDLVGEVDLGETIQYEEEEEQAAWPVSTPQ
jgi:hypothetical protein